MFSMTIEGEDVVLARLAQLENMPQWSGPILRSWSQDVVNNTLSGEDKYPPKLPAQRYERTGRLGRGWNATTSDTTVQIQNAVSYADEVVGDIQSAYFYGRWWQAKQRISLRLNELPTMFETAMDQMWNSGTTYDVRASRFRSSTTGRFVSARNFT